MIFLRIARFVLCSSIICISAVSNAATLEFPGPGACVTDLQLCINSANSNDVIELTVFAPTITSNITIGKALTLRSGPAMRAKFSNMLFQLNVTEIGNQTVVLKNLLLDQASVSISIGSNEPLNQHRVQLEQLEINDSMGSPGVQINTVSNGSQREVLVSFMNYIGRGRGVLYNNANSSAFNFVSVTNSRFILSTSSAQAFYSGDLSNGARIDFKRNHVEALPGADIEGIRIQTPTPATGTDGTLNIERNRFLFLNGAVVLDTRAQSMVARVRNNTFYRNQAPLSILNQISGNLDWRASNNIFYSSDSVVFFFLAVDDINRRISNLYSVPSGIWINPPLAGFEASAILLDPMFRSAPSDLHLKQSSPARDAGNNAEVAVFSPDFDGIPNLVGAADIGAHEWTDAASDKHIVTPLSRPNPTNDSVLDLGLASPVIDAPVITPVFAGNGTPLPMASNENLGLYNASGNFAIFNQSPTTMPLGREFFVMRSGSAGDGLAREPNFIHRNQASNISGNYTQLSNSNFPNVISVYNPIITQRWDPPSSNGVYNNSAVGVWFSGGSWRVFNQDGGSGAAPMPIDAGFHVLVPSVFADYTKRVSSLVSVGAMDIDHPRTNNNPNARVFATAAYGDTLAGISGTYIPSQLGVRYDITPNGGGRWLVVRGDGNNFPPNSVVHVYIEPESNRLNEGERLFSDGFE